MLRSMTGFGRGIVEADDCKITVEIKSVNNRFFDCQVRMPRELQALEVSLRQQCQSKVSRGKLEINVNWSNLLESKMNVAADLNLAKSYADAILAIARHTGVSSTYLADPLEIAKFPQVLKSATVETNVDFWQELLERATEDALDALILMREAEGLRLKTDMHAKLAELRRCRELVAKRSPDVIAEYRERLVTKLNELMEHRAEAVFGEDRLAAEVLVFADKAAVDEELVRLKSHFDAVEETLSGGGDVGKKLDFLIQEMNREINTIGSKANDLEITNIVVEMKSLLEKVREQTQNIE